MILNLPSLPPSLEGCCNFTPATEAFCYIPGVRCPTGSVQISSGGCSFGAPQNGSCDFTSTTFGAVSTLIPGTPLSISTTGQCIISATSSSNCGCPNSVPITQSVDLCNLAISALENLNPESLNLFGAPCNA